MVSTCRRRRTDPQSAAPNSRLVRRLRGVLPPSMSGVLDGVRVVEVAQWWFVPAAGAVLADWGADVIKLLGIDLPVSDRTQPPNPIVNSYRTRDGRWLFLNMLQPDRYWPDLCRRLGRPDLLADPRFADGPARFAHRAECVCEPGTIFATR